MAPALDRLPMQSPFQNRHLAQLLQEPELKPLQEPCQRGSNFFAKAPNNMLISVVDRLTASNRYSSIKDSFILESVVVAHEILHGVYTNKKVVLL